MESLAVALSIAIPIFCILICMEYCIAHYQNKAVYRGADTISSLSSGITNIIKDVLGLSIAIVSYEFLFDKFALTEIKSSVLIYVVAFVTLDFAGYWMHRLSHEVNFLWNRHVIHHSSEEFNLACALRQSISTVFTFITIFMMPAALVGIPPKVIAFIAPIHLFAQFWYHTRLIGKMGIFEYVLVTPSHHRVHHAMNDLYLDKNYGQIFIFWDFIFGTFQEELETETAVYGVKRPVSTWNPIRISLQHIVLLYKDAWRTESWSDKFLLWFKPTGYRPKDVVEKYPVNVISDVYSFKKYSSSPSKAQLAFAAFQLVFTLLLAFYLFFNLGEIGILFAIYYAFYLFASVYSFTALLDKDNNFFFAEVIRFCSGLFLIYYQGWNWFGLNEYTEIGTNVLLFTMLCISFASYLFYRQFQLENHTINTFE